MAKSSKILKEERASKIKAQGVLLETRKAQEGENFTEEQTTQFRSLNTEIEDLDAQIEARELEEAAELRVAALSGTPVGGSEQKEKREMVKRYSLHKALRSQLPTGDSLDGVEAEYDQEMRKEARAAGVPILGVAIPNAVKEQRADGQTVTQDGGAYGANLVGTDHMGVIDLLRPKPILASMGATYMRGLTGNVEFATNDGGIVATWEGEVDTTDPTKNAYGKKTMAPKRVSATVPISLQNILQSSIALESYTANEIRLAVENAIDLAGINGSGTGNVPLGILNASGTNVVTAGDPDGGAPTWAQIVAMETGVFSANAEADNMGYLINSGTKGFLKTTKHEAGDLGYLMTGANAINGYNVGVSNLVPNDLTKGGGTALNAGIFGNFADLLIGEWGFYDMVVDQITGKKSGVIEITVNQFLDILLKHSASFSVVKDWDIS